MYEDHGPEFVVNELVKTLDPSNENDLEPVIYRHHCKGFYGFV